MQYFDANPESNSKPIKTEAIIKKQNYTFWTDAGVFSKRGLDFGTRSLLENIPYEKIKGQVLDLGCGYGPIGIVIKRLTDSSVDMSDINKRALSLTEENAKENKVKINTIESDGYQNIVETYDYIVTNPPIRVGNTKLYELLIEAQHHLKENGELWFVIAKDQGAKTIMKHLEAYYQITLVKKNKGFYIMCAKKIKDLQK